MKCTRRNPETFSVSFLSLRPTRPSIFHPIPAILLPLVVEYSPHFCEPLVPLKRFMQIRNKALARLFATTGTSTHKPDIIADNIPPLVYGALLHAEGRVMYD